MLSKKAYLEEESASYWGEKHFSLGASITLNEIEKYLGFENHSSEDTVHAQKWWLCCQLELEQAPASALITPLEEVYKLVEQDSAVSGSIVYLYLMFAGQLWKRSNLRLSIIIFEKSLQIINNHPSLHIEEMKEIYIAFQSVISAEKALVAKRNVKESYLVRLDTLKEELKCKQAELNLDSSNESPVVSEAEEAEREESEDETRDMEIAQATGDTSRKVRKSIAHYAVPFLVTTMVVMLISFTESEIFSLFQRDVSGAGRNAKPVVPDSKGVKNDNGVVSTDKKHTTEDAGEPSKGQVDTKTRSTPFEAIALRLENLNERHSSRSIDGDAKDVESDNTPVFNADKKDPDTLPSLDSSKFVAANREDLSIEKKTLSVDSSGIARGKDGRIFGRAPKLSEKQVDLSGAPVKPVAVVEFKKPKRFETIVATEVLSAPSVSARTITRLEQGSLVEVVSRMGRWLELQSRKGHKGYIYAQDAVLYNEDS